MFIDVVINNLWNKIPQQNRLYKQLILKTYVANKSSYYTSNEFTKIICQVYIYLIYKGAKLIEQKINWTKRLVYKIFVFLSHC